jgi:hypothetical protein
LEEAFSKVIARMRRGGYSDQDLVRQMDSHIGFDIALDINHKTSQATSISSLTEGASDSYKRCEEPVGAVGATATNSVAPSAAQVINNQSSTTITAATSCVGGVHNNVYNRSEEQVNATRAAASVAPSAAKQSPRATFPDQRSISGALPGRVPNEMPWLCASMDLCQLDKDAEYEAQYLCIVCCRAMHGALCGTSLDDGDGTHTEFIAQAKTIWRRMG